VSTVYYGTSYSYNLLATKTATTQRNTDGTGMTAHLSGLSMPALYPVDGDIVSDAGLGGAAREYKQAFARKQSHTDDGSTVDQVPDIKEGDNLIIDGETYRVRAVAEWRDMLHLIVGQLKGAA
jgi:hypothetical protein